MHAETPTRPPLRIALVGQGRMGRLVEELASEHGFAVVLRLDGSNNRGGAGLTRAALHETDVAIDFSTPAAVMSGNLERLCDLGIDTVVGTTGWDDRRAEILALARRSGIGLVYGANFSVGVNAFYRIAAAAARTLARCDGYDLAAFESHHRGKRDAPSGTALRLLDEVRAAGWSGEIDVTSQRTGHVPGTHELQWDSAADTVQIRHTARSRAGFARGALAAAQWIHGRSGVYDFAECWEKVVGEDGPSSASSS
ncbi:MAG: dihydrodipicolinate reductase [Gemmatimonadetes bacterium]|nr:dihydrodipicolinate reductase [Gemmatimonadota bacterium]MYK65454.1 dihydrodipicolinate reductase [Gemmatimonadota bacterium]